MIITVTNRNVQGADPRSHEPSVGDHTMFGDDFNAEGGPNELRVATAEEVDGSSQLRGRSRTPMR